MLWSPGVSVSLMRKAPNRQGAERVEPCPPGKVEPIIIRPSNDEYECSLFQFVLLRDNPYSGKIHLVGSLASLEEKEVPRVCQ